MKKEIKTMLFFFCVFVMMLFINNYGQTQRELEGRFPKERKMLFEKEMNLRENTISSEHDSNTTLIGRLVNGLCFAVAIKGNIAYFGNGISLEIMDISNPSKPIELGKSLPFLKSKILL